MAGRHARQRPAAAAASRRQSLASQPVKAASQRWVRCSIHNRKAKRSLQLLLLPVSAAARPANRRRQPSARGQPQALNVRPAKRHQEQGRQQGQAPAELQSAGQ